MVVLGVVIVFVACIGFICCIRPRGDSGYKANKRDTFSPTGDTPRHSRTYSKMSVRTPSPKPVTGSWSPGDAYDVRCLYTMYVVCILGLYTMYVVCILGLYTMYKYINCIM